MTPNNVQEVLFAKPINARSVTVSLSHPPDVAPVVFSVSVIGPPTSLSVTPTRVIWPVNASANDTSRTITLLGITQGDMVLNFIAESTDSRYSLLLNPSFLRLKVRDLLTFATFIVEEVPAVATAAPGAPATSAAATTMRLVSVNERSLYPMYAGLRNAITIIARMDDVPLENTSFVRLTPTPSGRLVFVLGSATSAVFSRNLNGGVLEATFRLYGLDTTTTPAPVVSTASPALSATTTTAAAGPATTAAPVSARIDFAIQGPTEYDSSSRVVSVLIQPTIGFEVFEMVTSLTTAPENARYFRIRPTQAVRKGKLGLRAVSTCPDRTADIVSATQFWAREATPDGAGQPSIAFVTFGVYGTGPIAESVGSMSCRLSLVLDDSVTTNFEFNDVAVDRPFTLISQPVVRLILGQADHVDAATMRKVGFVLRINITRALFAASKEFTVAGRSTNNDTRRVRPQLLVSSDVNRLVERDSVENTMIVNATAFISIEFDDFAGVATVSFHPLPSFASFTAETISLTFASEATQGNLTFAPDGGDTVTFLLARESAHIFTPDQTVLLTQVYAIASLLDAPFYLGTQIQAAKLVMLAAAPECPFNPESLQTDLSWTSSLFVIPLSSSKTFGYYAGSLLAGGAAVIVATLLHAAAVAGHRAWHIFFSTSEAAVSMKLSMKALQFPRLAYAMTLFYLQPFFTAALWCVLNSPSIAIRSFAGIALLAALICVPLFHIVCVLVGRLGAFRTAAEEQNAAINSASPDGGGGASGAATFAVDGGADSSSPAQPQFVSRSQRIFFPMGHWLPTPTVTETFFWRLPLYEDYRPQRTAFLLCDIISAIVLGIIGSLPSETRDGCTTRHGFMALATGVRFVLLVALQPFASRFHNVVVALLEFQSMLVALLIFVGSIGRLGNYGGLSACAVMLIITAGLLVIKAVIDATIAMVERFKIRRDEGQAEYRRRLGLTNSDPTKNVGAAPFCDQSRLLHLPDASAASTTDVANRSDADATGLLDVPLYSADSVKTAAVTQFGLRHRGEPSTTIDASALQRYRDLNEVRQRNLAAEALWLQTATADEIVAEKRRRVAEMVSRSATNASRSPPRPSGDSSYSNPLSQWVPSRREAAVAPPSFVGDDRIPPHVSRSGSSASVASDDRYTTASLPPMARSFASPSSNAVVSVMSGTPAAAGGIAAPPRYLRSKVEEQLFDDL